MKNENACNMKYVAGVHISITYSYICLFISYVVRERDILENQPGPGRALRFNQHLQPGPAGKCKGEIVKDLFPQNFDITQFPGRIFFPANLGSVGKLLFGGQVTAAN